MSLRPQNLLSTCLHDDAAQDPTHQGVGVGGDASSSMWMHHIIIPWDSIIPHLPNFMPSPVGVGDWYGMLVWFIMFVAVHHRVKPQSLRLKNSVINSGTDS
jgi:hypothetical protein